MTSPNHTVPILVSTGLTYDLDTLKKRKHSSSSRRLECQKRNVKHSSNLKIFPWQIFLERKRIGKKLKPTQINQFSIILN